MRFALKMCLIATGVRSFSTSPVHSLFWESHPKSGYQNKEKRTLREWFADLKSGWDQLGPEWEKFKEEVNDKVEQDPSFVLPGVVDKVWDLKTPESIAEWTVAQDSDHSAGYSRCSFTLAPSGHALFSGNLSTDVPKDGVTKRAGYCNIRSQRARKSFKRDGFYDWSNYTHLVIRCKGDGRTYLLNISTSGYFDQFWNDTYSYPFFTRGGPYWQTSRIPFSKFFFGSKGRVQDLQAPVSLDTVTHLGITLADRKPGPFSLEIDYIGVYFDPEHTEEFAYEMYRTHPNLIGS